MTEKLKVRQRTLRTIHKSEGAVIELQGTPLVNFSSNDYLGLKDHPYLKERAIAMIQNYGVGSGASRLVSGNYEFHERLEKKCAKLLGKEACLVFNSGYQANISLLPALLDRHSLVVLDRYCHNSLVQGAHLSCAKMMRYAHQDLSQLEKILSTTRAGKKLIVTETLFSMDGDITPLDTLISLAKQYEALLYVDDAHAVGVMGPQGMGLAAQKKGIDFVMGTFSKALGGTGAYLACSDYWKDVCIQKCGGLMYSTSLSPATVGVAEAALELIPTLDTQRQTLLTASSSMRHRLQSLGFDVGNSQSHIVPLIVGSEEKALMLQNFLSERGFYAIAIRPPSVQEGASRVRLSFTTDHSEEQREELYQSLKGYHG